MWGSVTYVRVSQCVVVFFAIMVLRHDRATLRPLSICVWLRVCVSELCRCAVGIFSVCILVDAKEPFQIRDLAEKKKKKKRKEDCAFGCGFEIKLTEKA